jgi:hypothetical protein
MSVEPGDGATQDLFSPALQTVVIVFSGAPPVKSSIIMIEPALKPRR